MNDLTALPILSFYVETPPVSPETSEVNIKINTDSYPEETSWQLMGINGTNFSESIAPGSLTLNDIYEWSLDVPSGDYQFTIQDSWGDGICCEDGVPVEVYNPGWETNGGWDVWPDIPPSICFPTRIIDFNGDTVFTTDAITPTILNCKLVISRWDI